MEKGSAGERGSRSATGTCDLRSPARIQERGRGLCQMSGLTPNPQGSFRARALGVGVRPILVHNHPTGEDTTMTEDLKSAADLLGPRPSDPII